MVTNTAQNWQVIYGGSAFAEGKMFVPVTTGRLFVYAPGVTRSDTFTATTLGQQWHINNAQTGGDSVGGGQLQLASGRGAGAAGNFVAQWPLGGDAASWTITTRVHFAPRVFALKRGRERHDQQHAHTRQPAAAPQHLSTFG